MKTLSKILSIALVLSMLLGFALVSRAAEPTLTLCTGTLQAGDKVVLATADKSKGISGWNGNKDFTVSANSADWVQYTVAVVSGGYTLKDESANKYIKAPGGNEFKYDASNAGTITVDNTGLLHCGDYTGPFINTVGSTPYYRFYKDKLGASGYTAVYVYVVSTGSGPACEHTYDNCEDTTCNKGCGYTRTAPEHVYDGCEDTTCANCTLTRQAVEHKYTNEYDASCNNANCTKTRTVTLPAANSTLDFATANKLGAAQDHNAYTSDKYYVEGTVKKVDNDTYGNITLEDESGATFYLYTVKDIQGNNYGYIQDNKPVVGDKIKVYGPIGRYSDSIQMNPAVIQVEVKNCEHEYTNEYDADCNKCGEARNVTLPAADSTLTLDVANKLGLAQTNSTYTTNKYYVEGTITEITSDTYGNMTIKDAAGKTFSIYGSFDSTGAKRFDAMENAPAVGDKIKIYGVIGQYNGTAQMKNGWIMDESNSNNNQNTNNPKDGDAMSIVSVVSTMVLSMGGVVALVIKRKNWTV